MTGCDGPDVAGTLEALAPAINGHQAERPSTLQAISPGGAAWGTDGKVRKKMTDSKSRAPATKHFGDI
jgi:hypothetical protein